MAAVNLGVEHVQGTMNGYGERTGNADLCTLIPNLSLKMDFETVPEESLEKLTPIANHIAELVNIAIDSRLLMLVHLPSHIRQDFMLLVCQKTILSMST